MSDFCLNCSGLIPEPGKSYGYAGKFCHCQPAPQYQRPSLKEAQRLQRQQDPNPPNLVDVMLKLERIERMIAKLQPPISDNSANTTEGE